MKTTIHGQDYEFYSWQELGQDVFDLAQQIIKEDLKIDRVVALAKGGLAFSRALLDFLGVKNLSTMQIEFYSNIGETSEAPVITQELPISIEGERVLIFDDITDSGETLDFAIKYLTKLGAKEIHAATMVEKPWTKVKADFTVKNTEAWVIFPNEIRETISLLSENWAKKGDSPAKIKEQLLKVGFQKPQVELFANLK